jgi:hypothetical protein
MSQTTQICQKGARFKKNTKSAFAPSTIVGEVSWATWTMGITTTPRYYRYRAAAEEQRTINTTLYLISTHNITAAQAIKRIVFLQ